MSMSYKGYKREIEDSFSQLKKPTNSWSYHNEESNGSGGSDEGRRKKKQRRSRWNNDDDEKIFVPGMPTIMPGNLTEDQQKAYLLQLQIEEISRRLRTGDLGIPPNPENRSPSPEPIYSNEGKRLNTREYRTRRRLEDERHAHITEMMSINTDYKPPPDYKPPIAKVHDKVVIPQEQHPDINFVGLLIGPRGNTLKSMQVETGAKIIIRGKGSVKEGKVGRKDGQPLPGEDEPLHAYVTATNPESVKKAVDRIKEIIRQGVEVPEGQNDLRRMQLRELALLNGTLRDNDAPRCSNCGGEGHKSWQCPDKPNVTNNILCTNCGGAGHIARDCRERQPKPSSSLGSTLSGGGSMDRAKIDEEYMSLMAELGEGAPPPPQKGYGSVGYGNLRTSSLFSRSSAPQQIMAAPPPSQPPSVQSGWNSQLGMLQSRNSAILNMPLSAFVAQTSPWQQSLSSTLTSPTTTNISSSGLASSLTYASIPPPTLLTNPPIPPPPSTQAQTNPQIWMQQVGYGQNINSQWQQQLGGVPAPVPPPPAPQNTMQFPWQARFLGVPPPPPPAVGNAFVGLPNLLAAPPPPPS